jgi:hypothetical protein
MNASGFLRGLLHAMAMGLLILLAVGAAQAQSPDPGPQLRAAVTMETEPPLTVGGTATLHIEVLTSTWFTQPPELPTLTIPGAMVTGPTGDATLIRRTVDGVAYSGMRYAYQVNPTAAGVLRVPSLDIRAQVGQASAPLTARTDALEVQAAGPPGAGPSGAGPGGNMLAATGLQLTQQVQFSAQPPAVGDHISRVITVQAQGAQAMLIPPPASADVPGLKAYAAEPVLTQLSDDRGRFLGGQRVDRIDYVVERPGAYALPEIEIRWWDLAAKQEALAVLPAQPFEARAGAAYQTPFSVQDDLRDLGRQVQVRIPGGWLAVAAGALAVALAFWLGRPWWRRASARLHAAVQTRRRRWQSSEAYAARALRRELARPDGRLDALYRWLRRGRHSATLREATAGLPSDLRQPAQDALRDCYGPAPDAARGFQTLRQATPRWRRTFHSANPPAPPHGLLPLNPRKTDPVSGEPS